MNATETKSDPGLTFHQAWGEAAERPDYRKADWIRAQRTREHERHPSIGAWLALVYDPTPPAELGEDLVPCRRCNTPTRRPSDVTNTCPGCGAVYQRARNREQEPAIVDLPTRPPHDVARELLGVRDLGERLGPWQLAALIVEAATELQCYALDRDPVASDLAGEIIEQATTLRGRYD